MIESILERLYPITQYVLELTGGQIPAGEMVTFVFTYALAGWMVSVDANLFLIAVLPLISKWLWFPVIILITVTHAIAGYLGLGLLVTGITIGATLWVMLGLTSWGGLRFIVAGLGAEDDDDHFHMAKKLIAGLFTIAAFALFWNVSYDEFFAVWQRFQWMVARGWNDAAMAVNIGFSMVVLLLIQSTVAVCLLIFKPVTDWFHERGDIMMFIVFGLLMYYLVRGWAQNGFGYIPWEIPYSGIAPDLLFAGFVLTWLLHKALHNKNFALFAKRLLLIMDDEEAEEVTVS